MNPLNSFDRLAIARHFLKGEGIEIGALHNPLPLSPHLKVKYVDRMSVPELRKQYPELGSLNLVNTDIIDNGEKLDSIGDETQDFIIANHFIEHCQDPISALKNMLRVVRAGGILYMAIPDKRFSFDVDRPVTTLEHVFKDFEEGPEWSKRSHFEEWARLVDKKDTRTAIENHVNQLIEKDYSIHYHVWSPFEMCELVTALHKKLALRFNIELFTSNNGECIFILRKD